MAVNTLGFTQISRILQEIVQQATGQKIIAPASYADFITVGQTALLCGTEQLMDAISSVLGRTIFSVRPYTRKFKSLERTTQEFGDMVRKLTMVDGELQDNPSYSLEDGKSIDQWIVKKDNVLQTNFYGFSTFEKQTTLFRNQLNVAFTGPDELSRFIGMKLQNVSNQIEQANEQLARSAICNLIGGVIWADLQETDKYRNVKLITEYNNFSGNNFDASATPTGVFHDDNIRGFATWFYARFAEIIDQLSQRSVLFHTEVNGKKPMLRQSPKEYLRALFSSKFMTLLDTRVHSEIFHNDYLKFMEYEPVSYWQSINGSGITTGTGVDYWKQYIIAGKITYLKDDGTLSTYTLSPDIPDATNAWLPIGVIFDRDAVGYTLFDQHTNRTPLNARGDYSNVFFKWTGRYWNDFTENVVVFTLN